MSTSKLESGGPIATTTSAPTTTTTNINRNVINNGSSSSSSSSSRPVVVSGSVSSARLSSSVTTAAGSAGASGSATTNKDVVAGIGVDPSMNETNENDPGAIGEREKRIVNEFVYLLDKSKQLFNGLKDLPQYGQRNSQWQAYFGRTFDTYTKLWKYQQQNRQVLDTRYGLKRWQIGEIASKIGQLYYHYYLRTSESNYLSESYSFYQAIQTRAYYSKVNKEEKPDLMVKKLRYLARFVVVCLLLKKSRQVRELINELSRQIDDYVKTYDPEDQLEWQLVKNEINDFIDADSVLTIGGAHIDGASNRLSHVDVPPISPNPQFANLFTTPPSAMSAIGGAATSSYHDHLSLQEIMIVGNCNDQIKFSELSLDMYRMLQAVERETSTIESNQLNTNDSKLTTTGAGRAGGAQQQPQQQQAEASSGSGGEIEQRENPHKYLLYKPTFSQFYSYLSSAFKDLPPHSVMMIYFSADPLDLHSKTSSSSTHHHHHESSYDVGGVRTNVKKELTSVASAFNGLSLGPGNSDSLHRRSSAHLKDVHCIYPGDLYPFMRKPMFLIVDSSNSSAFRNLPNLFGQPFLCLMSPINLPTIFHERQNQRGSIFTLFLANPLQAFCYICNITDMATDSLAKARDQLKIIFMEIARAIHKSRQLDNVFLQFSHDDFMRAFILRFVFCYCSVRLHRGFKGPEFYPTSQPPMSSDIIESRHIHKLIIDLSFILNIRQLFLDVTEDT